MTVDRGEALTLSGQHLRATSELEDGVWIFWVEDGAQGVEVTTDIGDPEAVARNLEQLARVATEHASRVRMNGLARLYRP